MKNKMKVAFVTTTLGLAISASAATMAFTGVDTLNGGTVSSGTLGTGSRLGSASATTTVSFSVTGADLQGVSGLTTVDVVLNIVSNAGNVVQNGGDTGITGGGSDRLDTSESLTFSFNSITTNLGAAVTTSFNGFTYVDFKASSAGAFGLNDRLNLDVDGTANDLTDHNANLTSDSLTFPASSFFTVEKAAAGGGDGFRVSNFSFSVDVTPVPEPSSTALLGLGGLALILRRRK